MARGLELRDFLSDAARDALHGPLESARGLPGAIYGEDFFGLEHRRLFPRSWCAVAVGAQLPERGDTLPIELGGWPLVLVRDTTEKIRCFFNLCRHRANKLVHKPCRGLRQLSCSWHGWTYELDGRLRSMPIIGGTGVNEVAGFDKTELGLVEVPCDQWLDFVFVNIDGNQGALGRHFEPLDAFLAPRDLSSLMYAGCWQYTYEGNWKVTIEGGIEDYHIPWGHPQLMSDVGSRSVSIATAPGCFAATTTTPEYKSGAEVPLRYRSQALPVIPGHDEHAPPYSCIINVFPTAILAVMRNHAAMICVVPEGAHRTRLDINYYFVGDAASDPALGDERKAVTDAWVEIVTQDTDFVRDVHEMYRTRDAAGIDTRFSPYWEGAVRHFQRMVVESLDGC